MRKRKATKAAPKKEATPKAAQPPKETKKAQGSKAGRGTAPKCPKWLKSSPTEYIVGTEDYVAIVKDHNDKFGSAYNPWRVRPQVFYTIHETIWNHYHDKK